MQIEVTHSYWDNTLVDTWPIIHAALNATFTAKNKPLWTFDETRARVRKSMRDSFPEIFGDSWQEAGDIYQREYRAHHLAIAPLEQSLDVLKKVQEKSLCSVVVSNKKGPTLREEIATLGWTDLFNGIVGAGDAARDKPHADPVHMALEKTGITPGPDVWFIGDSDVDLECALETGCTAILYGNFAKADASYCATHYLGFPYHAHVLGHGDTLKLLEF